MPAPFVLEKRADFSADIRIDGKNVVGYAAVYNSWSHDLGGFVESIAPGAFSRSLKSGRDVRCLFDHDSSRVLGRQSARTLELFEDEKGLGFSCVLGETTFARDLREMLARRDVDQCSFGFTLEPDGDEWLPPENSAAAARRILRSVNLFEVSVVTFPAYEDTSANLRALSEPSAKKFRSIVESSGNALAIRRLRAMLAALSSKA